MLRLDFLNREYSLEEVIDAYTDGSLDNFKGDKNFLDFLISYSLGNNLVGDDADNYKEYADFEGLACIMRLDEYKYFGKKIYKIYEICGKDKIKFTQVCDLIGEYGVRHTLEKNTIDTNLSLKVPVDFVDDSIVLSSGKKPEYNPSSFFHYNLSLNERKEFDYELERSLRRRINESIKANGDNIPLLEEMISYKEKERIEREEKDANRVKDDYELDINNIYYGKETLDISGGVLGINMTMVSWFENTNIKILNNYVFRSVPSGDYCLIDKNGNIHIPDELIKNGNIEIGPNSPIRKVEIASIPDLFKIAIRKLNENPIENEKTILRLSGLLEELENNKSLSVKELKHYEELVRALYEEIFGAIFKDDETKDYEADDTDLGPINKL